MPAVELSIVTSLAMLLPAWATLVIGLPVLIILAASNIVPPLVTLGTADFGVHDLALLVVAFKVLVSRRSGDIQVASQRLYPAVGIFLGSLTMATLAAYFRLGPEVFTGELVSLLRFIAQVALLILVRGTVKTAGDLRTFARALAWFGYAVAGSVYASALAFRSGLIIGEVQATGSIVRAFGPVGDSVGGILLLFIFAQLILGRLLPAAFLGGALIATGTRTALLALMIGLGLLASRRLRARGLHRRRLAYVLPFVAFVLVLFVLDVGGMRSRISPRSGSLSVGLSQRALTASLAFQIFRDHPLTGVGYTGFRFLSSEYSAEQFFQEHLLAFAPSFVATTGNQYLQVAVDGGVPALAGFLWMLAVCLRTLAGAARGAEGEARPFLAGGHIWLASLALGSQFTVWLFPGSLSSHFLWVTLGLALASNRPRNALWRSVETRSGAVGRP